MTAAIEVISMRRIGRGSLQAIATVRLGPLLIHGIKILQRDGEAAWLGLPQTAIRKSGTGWTAAVTIDDPALLDQIKAAVLGAWQSREIGR